jgi:hypothetical protein
LVLPSAPLKVLWLERLSAPQMAQRMERSYFLVASGLVDELVQQSVVVSARESVQATGTTLEITLVQRTEMS